MILGWKVRVCVENHGYNAAVILTRNPFSRFYQSGIRVATLDLARDDAEQQLAEARAKALSLLVSVGTLEDT